MSLAYETTAHALTLRLLARASEWTYPDCDKQPFPWDVFAAANPAAGEELDAVEAFFKFGMSIHQANSAVAGLYTELAKQGRRETGLRIA